MNPFNLSFSLVKDAKNAMEQNQYALAKLYSTLSALIDKGALGVDEANLNLDNAETLKAGFGTSVLIYNYCALKQIALEYKVNNQPINFYNINTKFINKFASGCEEFEKIIRDKKHAVSSSEDIKKEQDFATLFPQMPSNFEKIEGFNIIDYSKNYTISNVLLRNKRYIGGAHRFFNSEYENEYKKRQNRKECETWRNIIKKPPVFIQTPLTEQYSKDKVDELYNAIKKIKSSSEIAEKIQNFKTEYPIVLDFSEFDIFETIVENLKEENENEIIKIFNQLLNSKDIIINEKDDPLYYAFLYNKLELAKYLIKNKFNLKIPLSIYNTYEEALFKSIECYFFENDRNYIADGSDTIENKYNLLSKHLIQLKIKDKLLDTYSLLKNIKDGMESLENLINYELINYEFMLDQTIYLLWFQKLCSVYYENNKLIPVPVKITTLVMGMLEKIEEMTKKIDNMITKTNNKINKNKYTQIKTMWKGIKECIETSIA